jgi:tRNA pseudouridine55 synthase
MDGILLIDKPLTWTSFDVVNYVRKTVATELGKKPKNTKVGHTGTLDPLASGLLVLVVGTYCRRAQEFSKLDKTYTVTARLGATSSTGDDEGEKTVCSSHVPSAEEVATACKNFIGEISQIPPVYSAIKVNGKRAYDLARQGKTVALEPRKVTIHNLTIDSYQYPDIEMTVEVSSGTYIRTLVEDIGAELSTGAYTAALRRTAVGDFSITHAVTPQEAITNIKERLRVIA